MNPVKDKLRRYYKAAKFQLNGANLEFDPATLPWIDRADADIDGFLKTFPVPADYPYDLGEKLRFWRENGYVILEGAVPPVWLDQLWAEIEQTIREHKKHHLKSLVYQFNDQKETPICEVPEEKLSGIGARLIEYHNSSVGAKRVMTHPNIATFLRAVFNEPVAVFQSLIFKYGSQQDVHQDFPWVRSQIASHLAAAWIPLEDVHPDSGPLFYYPGSHRMPKFNFGTGILYRADESLYRDKDFAQYLEKTAEGAGLKKSTLLLKKGDILIWHAALAHGGNRIGNPALTRKSFVCHYSTLRSYPKHRLETGATSQAEEHSGVTVYKNPENLAEENCLTEGKDW